MDDSALEVSVGRCSFLPQTARLHSRLLSLVARADTLNSDVTLISSEEEKVDTRAHGRAYDKRRKSKAVFREAKPARISLLRKRQRLRDALRRCARLAAIAIARRSRQTVSRALTQEIKRVTLRNDSERRPLRFARGASVRAPAYSRSCTANATKTTKRGRPTSRHLACTTVLLRRLHDTAIDRRSLLNHGERHAPPATSTSRDEKLAD